MAHFPLFGAEEQRAQIPGLVTEPLARGRAGWEQSQALFPRPLGRPFIFKQDPGLEEDLAGSPRRLPLSSSRGQSLGAASCWGWEAGREAGGRQDPPQGWQGQQQGIKGIPELQGTRWGQPTERGRGEGAPAPHTPSTWMSSGGKETTPGGWMRGEERLPQP